MYRLYFKFKFSAPTYLLPRCHCSGTSSSAQIKSAANLTKIDSCFRYLHHPLQLRVAALPLAIFEN